MMSSNDLTKKKSLVKTYTFSADANDIKQVQKIVNLLKKDGNQITASALIRCYIREGLDRSKESLKKSKGGKK